MSTPKEHPRIGFIGLGIMGLPMATKLAKAGYHLTVNTRTPTRAQPVLNLGAEWQQDAASVARTSDVVITMLPDSPMSQPSSKILLGCLLAPRPA